MNSNTSRLNIKDDSEMTNISQSDLLMFLQFYFTKSLQNLTKILSEEVIKNDSEIYKITSSFNFWLNFSLNFKDTSFVNLLLSKNDDRANFCKKKLKEIVKLIVKFLYENLKTEEAFNKVFKDNYHKLYELFLKLRDIIDNIYNSDLKDEIFINTSKEQNNDYYENENEEHKSNEETPIANRQLKIPKMSDNINEMNQFNNKAIDMENLNNIIKKSNFNNIIFNENNEDKQNNEINQNKKIEDKVEGNNGINNSNNNNSNQNNNIMEVNCNLNNLNNNILIYQELQFENNIPSSSTQNFLKYFNNSENITFPLCINIKSNNSNNLDYNEINKLFYNFCYFTNFDLNTFQDVFYEKIGYAFLNYNGDFMWADEYTTNVLFEEDNIKRLNLFNIMTDFSKYIIKKRFKDHFFDFKDNNNRLRIFTYTIDGGKNYDQENKKKGEKLFDDLSKIKTLVSRATPVLLNGRGETYIACIFLETKFSKHRQNFDYFYWKSDWNNK